MDTSTTLITTCASRPTSVTTPGSQGGRPPISALRRASGSPAREPRPTSSSTAMTVESRWRPTRSRRSTTTASRRPTPTRRERPGRLPHGTVLEGARSRRGGGENFTDSTARTAPNPPTTAPVGSRPARTRSCADARLARTRSPTSSTRRSSTRPVSSRTTEGVFGCPLVGDPDDGRGDLFKYIDQAGIDHYTIGASVASFPGDGRERVVVAQFDDGSLRRDRLRRGRRHRRDHRRRRTRAVESRTAENPPNERFAVTVPGTSGTPTTPTWSRPSWSTAATAT